MSSATEKFFVTFSRDDVYHHSGERYTQRVWFATACLDTSNLFTISCITDYDKIIRERFMPEKQIEELIKGCLSRDRACYTALIEQYTPRLYGFFIRMGYAADISEDLTQELFIKLPGKLEKYQDTGQFEAWLFRVAANMARDFSRKKSLKTVSIHIKTADGDDADMFFSDVRQKPSDEILSDQETKITLEAALTELSPQEREFIILRHYSQMGFKEIAQEFGVPVGTVLSKVHRGLKKLKKILS